MKTAVEFTERSPEVKAMAKRANWLMLLGVGLLSAGMLLCVGFIRVSQALALPALVALLGGIVAFPICVFKGYRLSEMASRADLLSGRSYSATDAWFIFMMPGLVIGSAIVMGVGICVTSMQPITEAFERWAASINPEPAKVYPHWVNATMYAVTFALGIGVIIFSLWLFRWIQKRHTTRGYTPIITKWMNQERAEQRDKVIAKEQVKRDTQSATR